MFSSRCLPHLRKELELLFVTSLKHTFQIAYKIKVNLPKTNPINEKKLVSSSQPLDLRAELIAFILIGKQLDL
jgi:hypothetical protein